MVCRATKWVIQGEMLLVTPPTDLAAGFGSSLVPVSSHLGLKPHLPLDLPTGNSG